MQYYGYGGHCRSRLHTTSAGKTMTKVGAIIIEINGGR